MKIQIGCYDENDSLVQDWGPIGRNAVITSGDFGSESLALFIRLSRHEKRYWWNKRQQYFVWATFGGERLWGGRLEDVQTVPGGLQITAMGHFRAFSDLPYTRLWSTTGYANWEPVTQNDESNYNPELFEIDNNNRLKIGPLEDQTFATSGNRGGLVFKMPHNGEADAALIQFKFTAELSTNWRARLYGYDEDFATETSLWTQDGTGSTVTGATVVTLSPAQPYIVLALYRITSSTTYASDNASDYIELTEVRISSTAANDVSTSLGTTIAAGTRTVTPGSMTHIYVGQKLAIGGTNTEQVTVTAVTSTTFTAVFAYGHNSADTVRAIYVSAEEIVESLISFVNGVNGSQVSSATYLVQDTDRDLLNASWQDALPADILIELAGAHNYEVGVDPQKVLFFRPRGDVARTWYVDADVALERTLEAVRNSAYGVFADERGRLKRTAVSATATAVTKYGMTRRAAVFVDTSDETKAEAFRDDFLTINADPDPRASVFFDRVYTNQTSPVPLFFVRAGDYLKARNVQDSPRIYVSRAEYMVDSNQLLVEPEIRPPTIAEGLAIGRKGEELARRVTESTKERVRVI